jgi:hypothetical protein
MKSRRGTIVQDAGVIGWISISEVFLLCGVTMLTIALAVESNLDETRVELDNVKKAESEVPALKQTIVELEQTRHLDRRTILDLSDRLALSDRKASKLADEVADLRRDLQLAGTERNRLAADLKSREFELARFRSERLGLELEILKSNDAHGSDQLVVEKVIRKLADRLNQIDESIVMPLKAAKLVVKIGCEGLPAGYDIDLFVEDPHDEVCFWAQPRIMWEARETGFLMLSEDLRNLRNTTEEIFYSPTIEPSDSLHTYVVYCMLRAKPGAPPGPLDVLVRWEVSMTLKDAIQPTVIKDGRQITTPGKVVFANNTYGYPGLVPLTAFWVPSVPNQQPQFLSKTLPGFPRRWAGRDLPLDAQSVIKTREQ